MPPQPVNTNSEINAPIYWIWPSTGDGAIIISRLADRFKDGFILLDDGDAFNYYMFYLCAVIFFGINQIFWWKFLEYCQIKQFV